MANLTNVIFCLRAESVGNNVNAEGILSTLTPNYIPGLFSFSAIVSILGISAQDEHTFRVLFTSPTNESPIDISDKFVIPKYNDNLPEEYKGLNLTMNFNNIDFKVSGLYKMSVFIDGTCIGDKSIYVKGKNES